MSYKDIIDSINKLSKAIKPHDELLSTGSSQKEIDKKAYELAKETNKIKNENESIIDYVKDTLVDNSDIKNKLKLINNGINTKVDLLIEIFDSIKSIHNIFEELDKYIRNKLPNRINLDDKFKTKDVKVLSNILRNEIWGWNKFGDQTVGFGFFIKDIINNLQKFFLEQGVKKELNKSGKTLENSEIQNEEKNKKIKLLEEENDKLQKYKNELNIILRELNDRIKLLELYKNDDPIKMSQLNKELKELKESYTNANTQNSQLKERIDRLYKEINILKSQRIKERIDLLYVGKVSKVLYATRCSHHRCSRHPNIELVGVEKHHRMDGKGPHRTFSRSSRRHPLQYAWLHGSWTGFTSLPRQITLRVQE